MKRPQTPTHASGLQPVARTAGAGRRRATGEGADSSSFWRRWLGSLHFSGVFWYRLHIFGVRVVPRWLLPPFIAVFSFIFFCALAKVRRAVIHNLSWVLAVPPRGRLAEWRVAWRTVHNLAWALTETYEGLATGRGVEIEIAGAGKRTWEELQTEPRGFVLVTAHVGHWEIGSRMQRAARTVHVVRQPEMNEKSQAFLSRLLRKRAGDAVRFHYAGADDMALGARLLSALRRGEIVALQGDRASRGGRCYEIPFFGNTLKMPAGPAALARLAEVPLVPVFVVRAGRGRSRVLVGERVWVDQQQPREEAQRSATAAVAEQIEAAIRCHPYQWFSFRDLWGKRPRQTAAPRRAGESDASP